MPIRMKRFIVVILCFLSTLPADAQTSTFDLSSGFPVQAVDSGLLVIHYSHAVNVGVFHYGIDSIIENDSTISFQIHNNTDVCQDINFSFILDVDSASILRVQVDRLGYPGRICQGVNHNTFTILCRKTDIFVTEIKGVGFAGLADYMPIPAKTKK